MSGPDSQSGALTRALSRFGPMVRSVGRRRGLDDAALDELTQEVRVRLWRALQHSEKIDSVSTSYVYRAAMSAAMDMIRATRRRNEEPITHASHATSDSMPDERVERRELAERIEQGLKGLREPRDVIVRLYLSGYSREEISDLLGWSEPKVRNLLYRGMADLRVLLERADEREIVP